MGLGSSSSPEEKRAAQCTGACSAAAGPGAPARLRRACRLCACAPGRTLRSAMLARPDLCSTAGVADAASAAAASLSIGHGLMPGVFVDARACRKELSKEPRRALICQHGCFCCQTVSHTSRSRVLSHCVRGLAEPHWACAPAQIAPRAATTSCGCTRAARPPPAPAWRPRCTRCRSCRRALRPKPGPSQGQLV
jgi:hypothetical protein